MTDNKAEILEVEIEDLGEQKITNPYNPEKIRVDHQSVNLGFLLEKLEYDEIDLNPDFQREGDLWSDTKKSQLIESILLGLPLPSFYFSEDIQSKKWQVVDGLQRLSTFKSFWVDKELKLKNLEFLSEYEGKNFDDLHRAEIRKISGFKVNLYVIEKETPKEAKFLIFKRVNTAGLILTPQEIRHALNQGIPADFVKNLAQSETFKMATDNKVSSKRQQDRDFVNRFIAFYLLDYEKDYEGELDAFLNKAMGKLAFLDKEQLQQITAAFHSAMLTAFRIFKEHTFRKRFSYDERRKPISKALFDTISVNIAKLDTESQYELINRAKEFQDRLMDTLNNNEKFLSSISRATGQKSSIATRFQVIKQLIKEILR